MAKKFMHIMVDDDISAGDIDIIYESLGKLENDYDIAITTNKVQISTYDQDVMKEINDKIDLIMNDLSKFDRFSNQISTQIKYVFGLDNK